MVDAPRYRLSELLGLEPECQRLSLQELDALLAGRLTSDALQALQAHAETCAACAELLADVETFSRAQRSGRPMPVGFASSDRATRRMLRTRRLRHPWLAAATTAAAAAVSLWWWWPRPAFEVDLTSAELLAPSISRSAGPQVAIDAARAALLANEPARGIAELQAALRETPDDTYLLHDLGVVQLRSGDVRAAVETLGHADRLQAVVPSEETRFWLAIALSLSDQQEEACAMMRSVALMRGTRAATAEAQLERACR